MTKAFDFPYRVVHSRRKTAAIHVSQRGVEVRLPHGVSESFAQDFLRSKISWVTQKWDQQQSKASQLPKLVIGEPILWFGQPYTLVYQRSARRKSVFLQANCFVIEAPCEPDTGTLAKLLEAFFKEQAKRSLPDRTKTTARDLGLESRLSQVTFRRTKTKWGHCTARGVIQYNWLILGAPQEVVDYLVCHEVCHLKHPHHGAAFWRMVERACPDYRRHEHWLKEQGHRLDWVPSF